MQVRDDGSLILATHNRTYPMATVAPLVPSPCQRWVISGHSTNFVRCPRQRSGTVRCLLMTQSGRPGRIFVVMPNSGFLLLGGGVSIRGPSWVM